MEKQLVRKKIPLLAILFIFGIIFLVTAEYHSSKEKGDDPAFDRDAYTENLEKRLGDMIGAMDGVSQVKVMVTLEGNSQYSASQETDSYSAFASETEKDRVYWVASPEIRGVSVVCEGGADLKTKQKILDLIAGTLNLNKNKIYVTQ